MSNRTLRFISTFVRHPRQIGAVVPSSRALARAMVEGIDLGAGQTVLELGPGTGAFTREVLDRMPDGAHYLGVELSRSFAAGLRQRFPGVRIAEGSAEDVVRLHAESGLPPVRAVLCGLPFASLPESVQDGIVTGLDALLRDGGEFRTFQYVHAYGMPAARAFRARMDALFGPGKRSKVVRLNVPPAYVVSWSR